MRVLLDLRQMQEVCEGFDRIEQKIRRMGEEIDTVRAHPGIQGEAYIGIADCLSECREDLYIDMNRLIGLKTSLLNIIDQYQKCQLSVRRSYEHTLGMISGEANIDEFAEETADFGGWAAALAQIPRMGKPYIKEQEGVLYELQKTQTIGKLQTLFLEEKYQREHWCEALPKERGDILEDLFRDLNEIYGIQVADIRFESIESKPGIVTYGRLEYYNMEEDPYMRMLVNDDLLSTEEYYDYAMNTMLHEMRHGYQHAVINHPERYRVPDVVILEWADNFDHYIRAKEDYDGYINQSVEADARAFADQVIDMS